MLCRSVLFKPRQLSFVSIFNSPFSTKEYLYRTNVHLRWNDFDVNSHVNAPVYISLVEDGLCQFLRHCVGPNWLTAVRPFLVNISEFNYLKPIGITDAPTVTYECFIERLGQSSVTISSSLSCSQTNTPFAKGKLTYVFTKDGKSNPINPDIRQVLEKYVKNVD